MAKKKQKKPKNIGRVLEEWVTSTESPEGFLYRMKDGSNFGSYRKDKNPFDFGGHFYGIPVAMECKATKGKTMAVSKLFRKASNHQYEALRAFPKRKNVFSGYVVYLGALDRVLWIPVGKVPKKGSISPKTPGAVVSGGLLDSTVWNLLDTRHLNYCLET